MKRYLLALLFFFSAVTAPVYSANTDIWNLSGQGTYNGKDMVHVDSNYNLRLYNGNIYLGDNSLAVSTAPTQTTPSITVGGFYGIKVPFFNGSGVSTAIGSVVVASSTFGSALTSEGSMVAILATTTVMGIADGVYANGSVGFMTIAGYALVQTTGPVSIGNILVSTAPNNGSTVGWAGAATGTQVVGTGIGKALTTGIAAGGTVLAIINTQ